MRILLTTLLLFNLPPAALATEPVQFDYMMNCQGCHLPNGEGFPARNVPTIQGELGKFLKVEGGREFLIQVPGSAQSDLDDQRLAAVVNWMLTTFSADQLPTDFEPYSVEEVRALRSNPLIDVTGVREQLIKRIEQLDSAVGAQS